MNSRADRLSVFERWERGWWARHEAKRAARVERITDLERQKAGLREAASLVPATPVDLTPAQLEAVRRHQLAAGDPGVLDGAVSESALGGLLFLWQVGAMRRQRRAARKLQDPGA